MTIRKFSLIDHGSGWTLKEVAFGSFNLLVGLSGVGKTRILRALNNVKWAALFNAQQAVGCAWSLELEIRGVGTYQWTAETTVESSSSVIPSSSMLNGQHKGKSYFSYERLIRNKDEVLIERDENRFIFQQQPLPKLKVDESAISLLAAEPSIAPVFQSLQRIHVTEARGANTDYDSSRLEFLKQSLDSLPKLQSATAVPILERTFVLQENFPALFQGVLEQYQTIFPEVEQLRIGRLSEFQWLTHQNGDQPEREPMALAVKERGIQGWIPDRILSHGMLQTLLFLFELELSPRETVFLIDELEGGLGVNCLPQLIDQFLFQARQLQFIVTSHHPYVINNIPTKLWKIVTRQGSTVNVIDAESLPDFQTNSSHDKFILLINSEVYEEGIR